MNSARSGRIFAGVAPRSVIDLGEARRDTGSVMRRRRMGARTKIEDGEIWMRKDRASSAGGALPEGSLFTGKEDREDGEKTLTCEHQ